MKSRLQIARDVIAGYYGSGSKRTAALRAEGYDPDRVQADVNTLLCCRENIVGNIQAFAKKIADDNKYRYIYFKEKYGHECAVCHPHGGKNEGWQCIGYTIACWHHGGLPIPCNCHVISDGTAEQILRAKTDEEALKIARKYLKIKDIQVARNGGKAIPKSQAKAGDMACMFVNGDDFQHMYLIMSDKKIADATSSGSIANNIRADRNFSGRYVTAMKVIIRYTGKGLCLPPKRTTDELAREAIDGLWGSGDARKRALTEAGHDYNAVQARVNEILNPQPDRTAIERAIATAAKAQVEWSKNSVYHWQKSPTIMKSKTNGTCVTFVACTLQRIGVLAPGEFVWTDGRGYGDGKVIGENKRMTVTYYHNTKTVKDIYSTLRPGDILIFDDNKSGKSGSGGHICIFNGYVYKNGIHTYTGGHKISAAGKEKYSRKVMAVIRINSMPARKTIDEIAREVIAGKWGSGAKRKTAIINHGYDYDTVQKRVNEMLGG